MTPQTDKLLLEWAQKITYATLTTNLADAENASDALQGFIDSLMAEPAHVEPAPQAFPQGRWAEPKTEQAKTIGGKWKCSGSLRDSRYGEIYECGQLNPATAIECSKCGSPA